MLIREPAVNPMKSLKLFLANTSGAALLLALPLFTILPCLPSVAAPGRTHLNHMKNISSVLGSKHHY